MKATHSNHKYGTLKLMVGAGLMMFNFIGEANASDTLNHVTDTLSRKGKNAVDTLSRKGKNVTDTLSRKGRRLLKKDSEIDADSPVGSPTDVQKNNPLENPDFLHKSLQAILEAPCKTKQEIVTKAPFSDLEKKLILKDCDPEETNPAASETKSRTRSSSRMSTHRRHSKANSDSPAQEADGERSGPPSYMPEPPTPEQIHSSLPHGKVPPPPSDLPPTPEQIHGSLPHDKAPPPPSDLPPTIEQIHGSLPPAKAPPPLPRMPGGAKAEANKLSMQEELENALKKRRSHIDGSHDTNDNE